MVIDKEYINDYRQSGTTINDELEQILLNELGNEPHIYEYTEQDIFGQATSIIHKYKGNNRTGRTEMLISSQKVAEINRNATAEEACFSQLQQEYEGAKSQIKELGDYIEILKDLLTENSIEIPDIDSPIPF